MRPLQLKSLTSPPLDFSSSGGLRKPRASNSAGAASNGAQVVVSKGESPWQRPKFGKGDCNSRLTTPFLMPAYPGLGDEGTLLMEEADWKGGNHDWRSNRYRAAMHGRGQLERAVPVSEPTRLRRSERTQAT